MTRLVAVASLAAVAQVAGPGEIASASSGVVSFQRPASETIGAVEHHWTPPAVAAARPLAATLDARGRVRLGPGGAERNHPIPFTSAAVPSPLLSGAAVHGKLFTRVKGLDYECSATSVNSLNRSVILTAAHCVFERGAGFARRLAFVPGYGNRLRPLGTWVYDSVHIPREWFAREDHDFDFAAVVTEPHGDQGLNDAVGAVPLVANYAPEQQTYAAFGYPANLADGQQMWSCASPYGGVDPNAGANPRPAIATGCDMGDGSSGGGWILPGGGIGSVSAFGYDRHPNVLYGPYFGDRVLELFGKAERADPEADDARRFAACVAESRGCTHRLVAGDLPVLQLKDRERANTAYRVCVDSPGSGTECGSGRTGARGKPDYLNYLSSEAGRHVARWSVDGNQVATWKFRIFPENA